MGSLSRLSSSSAVLYYYIPEYPIIGAFLSVANSVARRRFFLKWRRIFIQNPFVIECSAIFFPPTTATTSGENRMIRPILDVSELEELAVKAKFKPGALAAFLRLSVRQLERRFLKEFQRTPTAWLQEYRFRIATRLVSQGYSTKAAASEVTYANASSFCHEFKKKHGISPQGALCLSRCETNVVLGQ
jgi:AraC-like DNA-binding protein